VHSRHEAIAAAVGRCLGTPFRPQGRVAGVGLDCIGVALIAAAAAGAAVAPPPYALGGDHEERLEAFVAAMGCVRIGADPATGDLLIFAPARRRRHVGIVVARGVVHAHAGLGRVVLSPPWPWPIVATWRFPDRS